MHKSKLKYLVTRSSKFLGISEEKAKAFFVEDKPLDDCLLTSSKGNMEALIFAPDPLTGVPQSDMAIILSKDTAPEVATFIRDNFMTELPDSPRMDNPDDVMSMSKRRSESIAAYGDRLQDILTREYESLQVQSQKVES